MDISVNSFAVSSMVVSCAMMSTVALNNWPFMDDVSASHPGQRRLKSSINNAQLMHV